MILISKLWRRSTSSTVMVGQLVTAKKLWGLRSWSYVFGVYCDELNLSILLTRWVDGICGSGQSGTVKNGGVENTGVDISAPCGKGGQCRSGQFGTMLQGWTLQELTMRHHVAGVDNAGVDLSARCGKGGQCGTAGVIFVGINIQCCNYWNSQYYLNTVEIVTNYLTDYLK